MSAVVPAQVSAGLEMPFQRLHVGPPSPLPFMAGVSVRSFLLERPEGNVIVYNSPGLGECGAQIDELGGATRLVLNHAHEGMYGEPGIEVPVFVGAEDRDEAARSMTVSGTFSERQLIDSDLEVIPTPGHTAGATSYLWDNGQHRFLFTGDSLWLEDGEWAAVVLGTSDRSAFLDSVAVVRSLDFDVLVPWVSLGEAYLDVVDRGDALSRLDLITDRVIAGGRR